jgi:biotin carboxylase
MRKKRMMIVNAGWEQVDLIRAAKEMGLYVIATDASSDAAGFSFADEHHVVDPRNLPALYELAATSHPDGIVADQCDYSHYASAFIAERLKLPGSGLSAVQNCTNKKWMREACQRAGILQPAFIPCKNFDEVRKAAADIGYPVIVKPLDNRGNFGVNKVEDDSQLLEAYYEAIANAHSRECLVEKFIEGTMATVDGFAAGHHRTLAVASKKMLGGRKRVAMEIQYPGNFAPEVMERLRRTHDRVVQALGITRGCTHGEYMVTESGDVYLIECANRGGGCYTSSRIVPALSGFDISKSLLLLALGESVRLPESEEMTGAVVLSFFKLPPGKIKAIQNLDLLLADDRVLAMRLAVKPGDEVRDITNDANRHGFVIARGQTVAEASLFAESVKHKLEVIYE